MMPVESHAEVPPREAWLYEDKKALESVLQGLRESEKDGVHDLGSLAVDPNTSES